MLKVAALLAVLLLTSAVGVQAEYYPGFTLYASNGSTTTRLLDEDGQVVRTWSHDRSGGYGTYLLDDGSVIRPARSSNSNMNGGAAAGLVQRVDQDNNLVWQYEYSSNYIRTHHDIEPMPNGNVLLVAWERISSAAAVQAGLDHTAEIWPDHIIEVQPDGADDGIIVWEWHFWDHLIQDHDSSKDNYGVVAEHPELIDVNLSGGGFGGDWNHINGISYDPVHDQIVISSHFHDEIYVIDHSTTTAEAASHSGGNSGMGGDLLYRWGNPSNYGAPGSQFFHVVHCPVWIPDGSPGAGNFLAYNNGEGTGSSIVAEVAPPRDGLYNYTLDPGQAFGPTEPVWTYSAAGFYSNHLGGCQRLPNGNTIAVESTSGNILEVDTAGVTQWSYHSSSELARALRYGLDHPGIAALGLVAVGVESGDVPAQMELATSHPNPFNPRTTISFALPADIRATLAVYNVRGQQIAVLVDEVVVAGNHTVDFDASGLPSGVYLCRLQAGDDVLTQKLTLVE